MAPPTHACDGAKVGEAAGECRAAQLYTSGFDIFVGFPTPAAVGAIIRGCLLPTLRDTPGAVGICQFAMPLCRRCTPSWAQDTLTAIGWSARTVNVSSAALSVIPPTLNLPPTELGVVAVEDLRAEILATPRSAAVGDCFRFGVVQSADRFAALCEHPISTSMWTGSLSGWDW